jgi:hypothetical protein
LPEITLTPKKLSLQNKTMRHFLLHLVLLPGLFFANTSAAQQVTQSEFLGRPTDHSITLQMFFDTIAETRTLIGNTPGNYTRITAWQLHAQGSHAEWLIDSLQPNQQYFYKVQYRLPGSSVIQSRQERFFRTAKQPGSSFRFLVQADPHMDSQTDTAVYNRCLKNQLEDSADFMIDLGDFLMTDKLKRTGTNIIPYDTIPFRCKLLRNRYEIASHSMSIFNTLGNHEGEAGWMLNGTANNIAIWNTNERKKYFVNPFPDTFYSGDSTLYPFCGQRAAYYSWTWGDALFVVIDPYWFTNPKPDSLHGWRWTLGQQQYNWLKQMLEQSSSTFKFIFSHQLVGGDPDGRGGVEFSHLYEWGGKNLDGSDGWAANRPGWAMPIKDVLTANRTSIFFHGHDHFFGKQQRDCLVYQECPQPSHPNFNNANVAADYGYFQGQILPNSGHIRVTVGPTQTKVEYIRAYKAADETPNRHNKDISATYFIEQVNCYDSVAVGYPIIWNSNYSEELIFPNPAADEICIKFRVKESSNTLMEIFDMQGKLIRTLIHNSEMLPGNYQLFWDGLNASGEMVSDGTYLCLLNGKSLGKIIRKKP